MHSSRLFGGATPPAARDRDFDDAEKGMVDTSRNLPVIPHLAKVDRKSYVEHIETVLSPVSPIHNGLTPFSNVPQLDLSWPQGWKVRNDPPSGPAGKKPSAPKPKIGKWILFNLWFNTYRKFFTFVTLLNLAGIIMAALGRFPYAENHLGALVLGNLLCAVLFRNELFLRFLYLLCIYGLRSWAPVCIKLGATSALQHVGGIHSGCALSGAAWLVFKCVDIIVNHSIQHVAVIATGVITNVFVLISILSAFPWVRNNYHNMFESHHRFIGWLGLAATWAFVILGNFYDVKAGEWRAAANSLLSTQELWFAVFMTIFVLIPWLTLREVPVEVEIPSPKVAILRFERGMQQGLLGRISRTSIMEYHAFGIISEGRHSPHHYMICGVQGDFTKALVSDPPKTVWTRELKFAGVGHASAMFKRGIRICTGTGIGAALSTCIQSRDWFLIWIGSDQEKTFGPTITGLIYNNIEPERMILWDSKKRGGRPDTMQLLKETWDSFGAEVIFITSNMKGNDEMMQGCRAAGLNAFGTLWDF
ncbi:related to non-ribosomal peptide synthetase [Cephalotrichum gorgonifer]|uniref:Related to non-ribosomal peptide synthetase n=1 Tax=Cephalotrichum gorgonifer TaxID=2041049 RepID=A0AAE8MWL6_9PEZI|nr:related to non-ribosomal peptide synthetase [Cephalotrichum gorgonifer]